MSSYELLELCEHMDEDGALKTALRGGEQSERTRAVMQIANEIAVLRAGMVPGADSELYGSQLFLSRARLREIADEEQVRAEGRMAVMAIGAQD